MSEEISVVGGGLGGLVAAICCAEAGRQVRLYEAHKSLGGRAASSTDSFRANFGPHALYEGRSNWHWLEERGLLPPTVKPGRRGVRYVYSGKVHRNPPPRFLSVLARSKRRAPVDSDFRSWATSRWGEKTAARLCGWAAAYTFDQDPGRLSAAFVWERLLWIYRPPSIRQLSGGWGELVGRLGAHAAELGVRIETGTRVDRLPTPPVIVATELGDAGDLLEDPTLRTTGPRAVLLDLGLESRRSDPPAVLDFDRGILAESFSGAAMAPDGKNLVQAHIGIAEDAEPEDGASRIEALLDLTHESWRERIVWQRRQLSHRRTGAIDLPGETWRDRPAIDRGGGVYLVGDQVAAPGLLSEVSFTSAFEAASMASDPRASKSPSAIRGTVPRVIT